MGIAEIAEPVCLICGITYNSLINQDNALKELEQHFGPIELRSDTFSFNFTDYYQEEMGEDLKKLFVSFRALIAPEEIITAKIITNDLELEHSKNEQRNVNFDPGYIELAKLILATTKNFDHRVYLGRGIYGDVHLRFRGGTFRPLEWTYPDYSQKLAINFFSDVRSWYRTALAAQKGVK